MGFEGKEPHGVISSIAVLYLIFMVVAISYDFATTVVYGQMEPTVVKIGDEKYLVTVRHDTDSWVLVKCIIEDNVANTKEASI